MEPPPIYPGNNQLHFIPLTSYGKKPQPPSYSQIFGPTDTQEQISTGPTEYLVRKEVKYLFNMGVLFQIVMRLVIGITLMTKGDGSSIGLGIFYCATFMLFWSLGLAFHEEYRTRSCNSVLNLLMTEYMCYFLMDYGIFLGIPAWSMHKGVHLDFQMKAGIFMSIFNTVFFVFILSTQVCDYKPLQDSEKFIETNTGEQYAKSNQLSVLEWSPFKIRLANIGMEAVEGPLTVVRAVSKDSLDSFGKKELDENNKVVLNVNLTSALEPGCEIMLIPETHTLPGANRVKNFRSFGKDRSLQVEVAVFVGKDQRFAVRRIQLFERREEKTKEPSVIDVKTLDLEKGKA